MWDQQPREYLTNESNQKFLEQMSLGIKIHQILQLKENII